MVFSNYIQRSLSLKENAHYRVLLAEFGYNYLKIYECDANRQTLLGWDKNNIIKLPEIAKEKRIYCLFSILSRPTL